MQFYYLFWYVSTRCFTFQELKTSFQVSVLHLFTARTFQQQTVFISVYSQFNNLKQFISLTSKLC